MQGDDLFPIKRFSQRVQESILEEFGGRCPSASEVAQVPDPRLLKLPGFGPKTLRKIRSVTECGNRIAGEAIVQSSTRLQSELEQLGREIGVLQDEFHRRQRELVSRLELISSELVLRWSECQRKA
ncbi:hypothetical protein [Microvirga zambiensis]|uniref:hypothetical protein n=1 Tax=Microvirga zambiensis TaxID=1402137 RepID=UPI00191F198A|nr:hypothetical protein [Microvirga zambiensis]